ncbi:MAG: hypothetical protein AAF664_14230 [Planctomycetota bacterium]
MSDYSDEELLAYLDEGLSPALSSEIESAIRSDPELQVRLQSIRNRDNAGEHTIDAIWRRHRLSCPSRDELGKYVLGILDPEHAKYIQFHIEVVGCRFCAANLEDLQQANTPAIAGSDRRRRYFQTSVGGLRSEGQKPKR